MSNSGATSTIIHINNVWFCLDQDSRGPLTRRCQLWDSWAIFGGTLCPKIERCHLCFSGPPGRTNGFGGWPQNESRGQLLGLWSLEKRRWHSWRESQMVRCVVLICFNHHVIYVRCKITKITQQKTVLGQMPWQCTDWSCSWDTSFCLGGIYKRLKKR